jgi:hypothetical protein
MTSRELASKVLVRNRELREFYKNRHGIMPGLGGIVDDLFARPARKEMIFQLLQQGLNSGIITSDEVSQCDDGMESASMQL